MYNIPPFFKFLFYENIIVKDSCTCLSRVLACHFFTLHTCSTSLRCAWRQNDTWQWWQPFYSPNCCTRPTLSCPRAIPVTPTHCLTSSPQPLTLWRHRTSDSELVQCAWCWCSCVCACVSVCLCVWMLREWVCVCKFSLPLHTYSLLHSKDTLDIDNLCRLSHFHACTWACVRVFYLGSIIVVLKDCHRLLQISIAKHYTISSFPVERLRWSAVWIECTNWRRRESNHPLFISSLFWSSPDTSLAPRIRESLSNSRCSLWVNCL